MDEIRDHILERIKILEDDLKYWHEKYLIQLTIDRYDADELRYITTRLELKQAIVGELNDVLNRMDKNQPRG